MTNVVFNYKQLTSSFPHLPSFPRRRESSNKNDCPFLDTRFREYDDKGMG